MCLLRNIYTERIYIDSIAAKHFRNNYVGTVTTLTPSDCEHRREYFKDLLKMPAENTTYHVTATQIMLINK